MTLGSVSASILAILLLPRYAAAQVPAALALRDAVARAVEANRAVLASRTARAISMPSAKRPASGPNPELGVEAERETPHWAFSGTLPIEIAGKRGAALDVAEAGIAGRDRRRERRGRRRTSGATCGVPISGRRGRAANQVARELEKMRRVPVTRRRNDSRRRGPSSRSAAVAAGAVVAQNESASAQGELLAARAELNALLAYPLEAAPDVARSSRGGPAPTLRKPRIWRWTAMQSCRSCKSRSRRARARRARPVDATPRPERQRHVRLGLATGIHDWMAARRQHRDPDPDDRPRRRRRSQGELQSRSDRGSRRAEAQITGAVASAALGGIRASGRASLSERVLPASLQVEQMAEESYERARRVSLP